MPRRIWYTIKLYSNAASILELRKYDNFSDIRKYEKKILQKSNLLRDQTFIGAKVTRLIGRVAQTAPVSVTYLQARYNLSVSYPYRVTDAMPGSLPR